MANYIMEFLCGICLLFVPFCGIGILGLCLYALCHLLFTHTIGIRKSKSPPLLPDAQHILDKDGF